MTNRTHIGVHALASKVLYVRREFIFVPPHLGSTEKCGLGRSKLSWPHVITKPLARGLATARAERFNKKISPVVEHLE